MYARATAVYTILSVLLALSRSKEGYASRNKNGSVKNDSQTLESPWGSKEDNMCDGGVLSGVNPIVDAKCASAYKVDIAEKDKIHKNVSPSCTEVVAEAKNRGLVPIAIFSIFSSPGNEDMSKRMPVNLNALVSSLFYNAAKDDSNTENGGYVFLKGAVADAFGGEGNKKNEKDDSKDKDKSKDEEGESSENEGADESEGGNKPSKLKR